MVNLYRFLRPGTQVTSEGDASNLGIYQSTEPRRVVLITLFQVDLENHDEIIRKVSRTFRSYDKIVYVTDIPEFLHFRDSGAAFEYFPSLLQQNLHSDIISWPNYLKARWSLLLAKWQPRHILAYGLNIDKMISAAPQRKTPAEPDE